MWIGEEGGREASSERRVVKREGGREGVVPSVLCEVAGVAEVQYVCNIYDAVGLNSTPQHSIA